MTERVAVVAGASPGLGSALCELLVKRDWRVAALGRERALGAVVKQVAPVLPVECDLTSEPAVDRAFSAVEQVAGPASLVIYNAHRIELKASSATSPEAFEAAWRANCYGAFLVAMRAVPKMLPRQRGTLIFSGATASVRGGKRSAAFASSKFALRGLAQSLARELSPSGIHVAHVVLDGLIWSERTLERFAPNEADCMPPHAVAAAYLALAEQDSSAWTHELDLRPATAHF